VSCPRRGHSLVGPTPAVAARSRPRRAVAAASPTGPMRVATPHCSQTTLAQPSGNQLTDRTLLSQALATSPGRAHRRPGSQPQHNTTHNDAGSRRLWTRASPRRLRGSVVTAATPELGRATKRSPWWLGRRHPVDARHAFRLAGLPAGTRRVGGGGEAHRQPARR
jgi:hypothetical protein